MICKGWLVPKDTRQNLLWRRHVLLACRSDLAIRRAVMRACREDFCFWADTFVYQYNPERHGHEVGPFILWPFQEEAVGMLMRSVEDRQDVRWQKSREMGASWLVLMFITWLCLFHHRKKALVISRDVDAVDRPDDPDCLFWKIDFILEHLPDWMTGKVGRQGVGAKGTEGVKRVSMVISFRRTQSTIAGEASTGKAGVGGRATIALIDEFGQIKDGYEIYSRTADTSHCRVFVFTHKDSSSMAYDLCYDVKYQGMREIVTHWSQHPDKRRGLYRYDEDGNKIEVLDKPYRFPEDFVFQMDGKPTGGPFPGIRSPWYDQEVRRRPSRAVSMDLDIDPRGASSQFFDGLLIKDLKNRYACDPYWQGDIEYTKLGKPVRLIRGEGPLKLWLNPKGDCKMPMMRAGAGCDLAWGTGATPSCLSIVNGQTGEKVLEYSNAHIAPTDAAALFMALCLLFKDQDGEGALLCWETQGPGVVFGRKIVELGYRRIYYRHDEDAVGAARDNKQVPGWVPNEKSRMALLGKYHDSLRKQEFINRSWEALDQCLNFVYTPSGVGYKGKGVSDDPAAGRVHHGDLVVADALADKMIGDIEPDVVERQEDEKPVGSLAWRRELHDNLKRRAEVWS